MIPHELWAWMANGIIHVTYYIGDERVDWVKHNTKTGTTTGSVKYASFNRLLDAANDLYQWMAQDPTVERALGLGLW